MHLAEDFRPLLSGQDLSQLHRSLTAVAGLRADGTIGYRNDAWAAVVSADDALEGRPGDDERLLDLVPAPLAPIHAALIAQAHASRAPAEVLLERPGPTRHRRYRLRALPLREGATLLVLRRVEERPHQQLACPPDPYRYLEGGVACQCAHCRRTRRGASSAVWDWVPAYVRRGAVPLQLTLCPTCARVLHVEPPRLAASA